MKNIIEKMLTDVSARDNSKLSSIAATESSFEPWATGEGQE